MRIQWSGVLAAVALLVSTPVGAATLTATAATFQSVFAAARTGDTIRLSGSFGRIGLRDRSFATTLTIDARAATFTDTLSLTNITGVKLLGGKYGNAKAAAAVAIRVGGSSRIFVSAPTIVGNGSTSHGIDIGTSTDVTVDGGSFTGLKLGVGFIAVTGGKITNNKSLGSSSDGFNVADSHNVLVSRNSCTAGSPAAGAHPDCVQLWSIKGNVPQSDIEISDNTATGATQGFTSFNPNDGGGDRIKFLRNRVDTSYPQGIACYNCRNSTISGNILTTQRGARYQTSINVVGGHGNTVSGNSVGARAASNLTMLEAPLEDSAATSFSDYDRDALGSDALGSNVLGKPGPAAAAVPEPASWLLMLGGFAAVGAAARRRRLRHA